MSHLSLKKKLKSRFCIAGCFRTTNHHHHHDIPDDLPSSPATPSASMEKSTHSPHGGIKTKSPRLTRTLSKSHEKCRSLIHRMGGGVGGVGGHGKHIRRHTTDFHYDPSSYALNFDKGDEDDNIDRFPLRNFSARLPRSPPSSAKAATESSVHNLLRWWLIESPFFATVNIKVGFTKIVVDIIIVGQYFYYLNVISFLLLLSLSITLRNMKYCRNFHYEPLFQPLQFIWKK